MRRTNRAGVSVASEQAERRKSVFLYVVLGGWGIVVLAATYNYIFRGGPIPDPILLGIPTGVWLAMNPPLPSAIREERQPNGTP
jgi:hypothetical protein